MALLFAPVHVYMAHTAAPGKRRGRSLVAPVAVLGMGRGYDGRASNFPE